jgi:polyketide biosynthesis 3-hydroxy-3-methylglutaryl-CoA synthase-like enzyme PksG
MLSLASTIANGDFSAPQRVGVYSYGSGCCSEFFSGVVAKEGQQRVRSLAIDEQLNGRYELSIDEYERLLVGSKAVKFGTRNVELDVEFIPEARRRSGRETCFLKRIGEFHREYEWVS